MRTRKPERTNDKKKRITLLGVIANGSTSDARKLLKKYDQPDAKNHEDLEFKLTKLYYNTPDKLQIEKDLADIHPHKEFILKYNKPEEKSETIVSEKFSTSQASGCRCNQIGCADCEDRLGRSKMSNACGCSSFDGVSNVSGQSTNSEPTTKEMVIGSGILLVGMLGIISIFALTIRKA